MRIRARHFASGDPIDLFCEGGILRKVEPATTEPVDLESEWVAPALFDLQINGCMGKGFSSDRLTPQQVAEITQVCHAHGMGAYCPTLVTNSFEALQHGFRILARARRESPELARAIPCYHLEGPYISPDDGPRGAHAQQHVRPPSWDEFSRFQDEAEGRIGLVTLSPEYPESLLFIEQLTASGVVVALGHTAASAEQIRDAVSAGAKLSTHLGNGSHGVLPRHPNYIWEQMAHDGLWASIIPDGFHLPDSVVKCIVRTKTLDRLVLTCDASSLAGSPPGRYQEWGQEFEVRPEGRVVVPGTPYLAGSAVFTDTCIAKLLEIGEVTLADAIRLASDRPRKLLGLPVPTLESGMPADLILFEGDDKNFRLSGTVIGGNPVNAVT